MSSKDFDFDKLIWPLKSVTFLNEYWEQQPLILSRKEPDYYSDLFSMHDVDSVIDFSTKNSSIGITIVNKGKVQTDNYVNSDGRLTFNQVYNAYHQSNTINLNHLQNCWNSIAILCRQIEFFFHSKVDVGLFITPNKSQGFSKHFDIYDVFILQIEGSKHWRIYDSFLALPMYENKQLIPENEFGDPLYEVCLTAGDLLYIPRGYVHEGLTSEYSSVHLSVGIYPFRLTDLISNVLTLVSKQDVSFRKSLPVGFLNHKETTELLKHQFEELLEILLNNARVEDAVNRLAEQFFSQMLPLPDNNFTQIDDISRIDLDTVVGKRKGMFCRIFKEEDSISIQFPGGGIREPNSIEPALCFIAESAVFSVRSIPGTLSDNEKLVLVRRLVREGLLMIV